MPPKELFGTPKLFIKPLGRPEADWNDIGFFDGRVSLATDNFDDGPDFIHYLNSKTSLSCTIKITRKKSIMLQQALGLLRSPHCTYKTVKQNCAKRNRIK